MARKRKNEISNDQNLSFGELFQSELLEECNFDVPTPVLCSTGSTLLDTIIGGGFLTGKYHVFAAPAHSGKSTTCIRTISEFLKTYKNCAVLWIDGEQSTPPARLMQLGVPYEHFKDENGNDVIDDYTGLPLPVTRDVGNGKTEIKWDNRFFRIPNNITLEKAFGLIDKTIQIKVATNTEEDPLLVIFDSLDSLPTQKEMETDDVDKSIGQRTKVLGYYMKRYLHKLAQYNICIIFITHIGKKLEMQGPYASYDGRMSSLKDFTIAGGKPIQFYPYNMVTFRAHMGKKISEKLENMGISSGFIVEATTMKAKGFSFNLTVPLVFNTLKGFDEYPTRYFNMDEMGWFKGTVSKYMPEFPDEKFNGKTFFKKLEEDSSFKEKVDISWNNYLNITFKKYHNIMNTMSTSNQNIDIDEFDETIIQKKMEEFLTSGDIGEIESHTQNTMNFDDDYDDSREIH